MQGKYQGLPPEEIDTADDQEEAEFLLGKYKMAYDSDWQLWIDKLARTLLQLAETLAGKHDWSERLRWSPLLLE